MRKANVRKPVYYCRFRSARECVDECYAFPGCGEDEEESKEEKLKWVRKMGYWGWCGWSEKLGRNIVAFWVGKKKRVDVLDLAYLLTHESMHWGGIRNEGVCEKHGYLGSCAVEILLSCFGDRVGDFYRRAGYEKKRAKRRKVRGSAWGSYEFWGEEA